MFPSWLRSMIRSGSTFHIRCVLTLASIYRDIDFPGELKISTITSPFSGSEAQIEKIIDFIPLFVSSFIPLRLRGRGVLKGKFRYFPISTSSPQTSISA